MSEQFSQDNHTLTKGCEVGVVVCDIVPTLTEFRLLCKCVILTYWGNKLMTGVDDSMINGRYLTPQY